MRSPHAGTEPTTMSRVLSREFHMSETNPTRRLPLSRRTDSIGVRTFVGSVTAVALTSVLIGVASISRSTDTVLDEKRLAFDAALASRSAAIEQTLATMQGHVASIAREPSTLDALREFETGFATAAEERARVATSDGSGPETDVQSIAEHHDRELASRFREGGLSWTGGDSLIPADRNAQALQQAYIVSNTHLIGQKHLLDSANLAPSYDRAHAAHHPRLRALLEAFGYYDIFLFDAHGTAVYTVFKETDFATNANAAPYASTNLMQLVRRTLDSKNPNTTACDFAPYTPSYGASAGFIAAPIQENGATIGAVVVQIPINKLDQACNLADGLGTTGEVTLVGSDGKTRTNARFETGARAGSTFAFPEQATAAIKGDIGFTTVTQADKSALVAYRPMQFLGERWAIVGTIDTQEAFAPVRALMWWIIAVSAAIVVCIALCAIPLARSIGRRARATVHALTQLAAGQLTTRIHDKGMDEFGAIGNAVNQLGQNLSSSIDGVRSSADELSRETQALAATSETLSSVASGQAASIEEMSAAVTQLREQTARTRDESRDAERETAQGAKDAETARHAVESLEQSMGDIDRAAKEIGQIVRVIDEIAFQTNLLALNAAVEAARAGEAGRGFAVVAQEVRALATRSGEAARRTTELVTSASDRVERGVEYSKDVRTSLGKILAVSNTIARSVESIAQAQQEQLAGITQLDQGIAEISRTTQEAAGQSQQVAATARQSAGEVESLRSVVGQFSTSNTEQKSRVLLGTADR
jgi:methyl-accepting chemotaxis protein